MRVTVITPPSRAVSLDLAKDHLKIRHDAEDTIIGTYLDAALSNIDGPDGWLGRALGDQVLEVRTCGFGGGVISLPCAPILSVDTVKYLDSAGTEMTVDASTYELRGRDLALAWGKTWPATGYGDEVVRIQYRAGYVKLPAPIEAAVLLMVGDMYRFRGEAAVGQNIESVPMSTTVEALLGPFRIFT